MWLSQGIGSHCRCWLVVIIPTVVEGRLLLVTQWREGWSGLLLDLIRSSSGRWPHWRGCHWCRLRGRLGSCGGRGWIVWWGSLHQGIERGTLEGSGFFLCTRLLS
jgi:hypothetical protein